MSRSTAIQTGIAIFVMVGSGLATATALSAEPPSEQLQVVLVADPPAPADVTTTSTSTTSTTTTTTTQPPTPTTDPSAIARLEALGNIPEGILTAVGSDTAKVIAFDAIEDGLVGWEGVNVHMDQGWAEFRSGLFFTTQRVSAPVVLVGLFRYDPSARWELGIETGRWNDSGFRRWGVFGDEDGLVPNVWEGGTAVSVQAPEIDMPNDEFWLVLGVEPDRAILALFEPDGSNPIGTVWEMPWDVDDWRAQIQVLDGSLWMDEYYVLVP